MLRLQLSLWLALASVAAPFSSAAEAVNSRDAATDLAGKLEEARRLHLTDSTRSRQLSEEALALARERGDRKNEATALVELAISLRRQNQNRTATHLMDQALAIIETLGDRALLRRAVKEAGHTYWAFADNATAIAHFQRALQLAEEDKDIAAQSDAHAGLGVTANDLRDTARANQHMKRALELAEQVGEPSRIAKYASNRGNALLGEKDYDGARRLFERSLAIFRELNQRTDADDSRLNLARVDLAEGKLESAERTLREILPARRKLRGRIKLTTTLVELADVLRLRGKYDEALGFLQEASGYVQELASPMKITVLDAFATLYESQKDYPAAIAMLRKRQEEALKQYGEAAQTRAAEYRETFAAEQREAEIERLQQTEKIRSHELRANEAVMARQAAELHASQARVDQARTTRFALAVGLGAGLLTLGAFVTMLRIKLRAERRIHAETLVAKEAAEQADRVKTRFLGIASHDIRGPLGNIVNLTASLRTDTGSKDIQEERCDMIGSEAQRVISLVEDLITTAALEAGKLELRLAPLDLAETTRATIESLRWQAVAKRQTIVFPDPEAGAGKLNGDAARLHQVIANLLSNAIKFSPPGETINLWMERTASHVRLSIRDRGAGISERDIARLFAPFERLATHPTAGESSHGLGLSIAQEITNQHGGTIHVDSKPGEGATFTVELPAH
ncbi:MAG: ATP-binding protein [Verrucomicrobiota bacterium]